MVDFVKLAGFLFETGLKICELRGLMKDNSEEFKSLPGRIFTLSSLTRMATEKGVPQENNAIVHRKDSVIADAKTVHKLIAKQLDAFLGGMRYAHSIKKGLEELSRGVDKAIALYSATNIVHLYQIVNAIKLELEKVSSGTANLTLNITEVLTVVNAIATNQVVQGSLIQEPGARADSISRKLQNVPEAKLKRASICSIVTTIEGMEFKRNSMVQDATPMDSQRNIDFMAQFYGECLVTTESSRPTQNLQVLREENEVCEKEETLAPSSHPKDSPALSQKSEEGGGPPPYSESRDDRALWVLLPPVHLVVPQDAIREAYNPYPQHGGHSGPPSGAFGGPPLGMYGGYPGQYGGPPYVGYPGYRPPPRVYYYGPPPSGYYPQQNFVGPPILYTFPPLAGL
ncbi:hypothetical protein BT69DRAFT_1356107 [Atractiella rhizophila]|nr:hypothetical protein BT69DRAFT_1356107 [Atractiella rhizophila]